MQISLTWGRKQTSKSKKHRESLTRWIQRGPHQDTLKLKIANIKYKDRISKAARDKQPVTYKGTPTGLSDDFSAETLQIRREWHSICKLMEGKNVEAKTLYPASLSFRFEGEIMSFTEEQKLKNTLNTTKPALQRNVKGTP